MVIGVRQRGQPRPSSSTCAAHDAQKRWWPQGTSAWRASRSSTRQTSQRSGGGTAADAATLLLAVGTSWRRRCRWSQTAPSRRMEHAPPNCGSQHAEIGFAYTRRYQSNAGRLWSVHRLSDLLVSWRDGAAFHDSVSVSTVICVADGRERWTGLDGPPVYADADQRENSPRRYLYATYCHAQKALRHSYACLGYPLAFNVPTEL